ncbi:glycosyltransferase-like domain-containing protein 1 isoform X2 [Aplysia californica]|uniref:tRNA-queuosine alpha-mannosyltransferase n=1 Tax=Aplysia californica TaxID=6500 RepID=A0ABM1VQB4_APLCA|nr:glycosyltransferase-like domain-containing protein 1 isoform X2 [Aplysia californica]
MLFSLRAGLMKDILIIEPFFGGSHGQLVKLLLSDHEIAHRAEILTLPAKKWHWRARTSALYFSQTIPSGKNYRYLFSSSVLNLAELIALRPDLAALKKIIYFHENQLIYPVRKRQDRDFQYGYNQILSSMVADSVIFNSEFNMESFLSSISSHLKLIPDHRPKGIDVMVRPKCRVLYFPISLPVCAKELQTISVKKERTDCDLPIDLNCVADVKEVNCEMNCTYSGQLCSGSSNCGEERKNIDFTSEKLSVAEIGGSLESSFEDSVDKNTLTLEKQENDEHKEHGLTRSKKPCHHSLVHIVWPHRWEHDKDPEAFFNALFSLTEEGLDFRVSVVGEAFSEVPDIFLRAKSHLQDKILNWGYQTREDYLCIIDEADVVVSTAQHEFFGVSMLEAVSRGCFPLCPKRLVYPEIYPDECLYSTQAQLVKRLKRFCSFPKSVRTDKFKGLAARFSWTCLQADYKNLFPVFENSPPS